jgi:hypothetical protein
LEDKERLLFSAKKVLRVYSLFLCLEQTSGFLAHDENFSLSFLTGEVILMDSKPSTILVYSSSLRNSMVLETILWLIEELLVFREFNLLLFISKQWSIFKEISFES